MEERDVANWCHQLLLRKILLTTEMERKLCIKDSYYILLVPLIWGLRTNGTYQFQLFTYIYTYAQAHAVQYMLSDISERWENQISRFKS